jgi:ferredoxin/menaquinone-dependent protoporphyrinogen IX oxidase
MKILILYFSGTGNTLYAVKCFKEAAERFGHDIIVQSIEQGKPIKSGTYDKLILGYPKYYENVPLFFLQYLKKNLPESNKTIETMAFCTQADALTTDFSIIEKVLKQKNHLLTVAKSFSVANNMIIFNIFHQTDESVFKNNIAELKKETEQSLKAFLNDEVHIERINPVKVKMYWLVAKMATKIMPAFEMKFSASERCSSCGLCSAKCPKNNIKVETGIPQFGKNCIFCMRCINNCPQNAILFNKSTRSQYKLIKQIEKQ